MYGDTGEGRHPACRNHPPCPPVQSHLPVKPFLPVLLVALLLMAGGCATTHRVQVSALAHPRLAESTRTYVLAAGDAAGHDPGELQYQEVLSHVRPALAASGFRETDRPADGESLSLFVDFGVGDPVAHTYTFSTPLYAELGGGYTTRTTTTKDAAGKSVTTTESVRVPGRYERVGTDVTVNTVTTYRKHLRLSARLREAGVPPEKGREVWTVTAIVDDQHSDLRAALPLLAAAIAPHLGRDTRRAVWEQFREHDGRLERVTPR